MREITSHFAAYGKAVIAGRKADGGPAGLIDHMDSLDVARSVAAVAGRYRGQSPVT
jgi:hypothetical protein